MYRVAADVNLKVMEHLQQLLYNAVEKATRARRVYKAKFSRRVKHTQAFEINDAANLNKTPTSNLRKEDTTLAPDPSVKLRPMKSGQYRVVRSTLHTVPIDVDGLHNVVAADKITLVKAANEEEQDTGELSDETSPAADPTTLNNRQDDTLGAEAITWHHEEFWRHATARGPCTRRR